MDERRFDDLSRAFGTASTRRALVAGVLGVFGQASIALGEDSVPAGPRRGKQGSRRGAMPSGWSCMTDRDCKAGLTCQNPAGSLSGACKPPGIAGQCQAFGEPCGDDGACCGALRCRRGRCLPEVRPVGARCRSGAECGQGECRRGRCACPDGSLVCGGACVDPATDAENCGECGAACAAGEWCAAGACAPAPDPCGGPCPPGQTCVDGACAETPEDGEITQADGAACGFAVNGWYCHGWAVGYVPVAVNARLYGPVYLDGMNCWSDVYEASCPICAWTGNAPLFCPEVAPTIDQAIARGCARKVDRRLRACRSEHCRADQALCGEQCVDLMTDGENCGSCGTRCLGPHGSALVCRGGTCVPPIVCPEGQVACRGTHWPFCTDLMSDSRNCGRCDRSCWSGGCCIAGACGACPRLVSA